jgi:hypothetical protein
MPDDLPLTRGAITIDAHGRKICPTCGHPAIFERRLNPDEDLCVPRLCPAWQTTAVFDHGTREWVPTGPDATF